MFRRILLNPDAGTQAGGATTTETTQAATTPPAAQPPAQQVAPGTVVLSESEYQRLYGAQLRLTTLEQEQEQARRAAEQAAAIAQAQRGEVEQAFDTYRQAAETREQQLRTQIHNRERDLTLSGSLLGVDFVSPEAAQQARQLLASDLHVIETNGALDVRHSQTGLRASDWIAQQLKTPAFAHFLKATTTGGNGQASADRTQTTATTQTRPANLGEALLEWTKNQQVQQPAQAGILRRPLPVQSRN